MKFYIETLGCKVNSYESNYMEEKLLEKGYIKSDINNCDIYIVNTCSVTNQADNKSMKMIRHGLDKKIKVVVGCMSQHNIDKIKDLDISIILGNKYKSKIVELIEEYIKNKKQIIKIEDLSNTEFENMTINNFDKTRAFVKIQDGCNNFCSYCIIPYTRGNVRSKNRLDVLKEIECLISKGFKEVVLTGIHTGHYGEYTKYDFASLLSDIIKIKGLKRLRISSIEITELNDRVLNILKDSEIIANHLHIPLQSGCNKILKAMNRKYNIDYFIKKIEEIRKIRPSIAITTDLIVGFPNETEEDFKETLENLKKINFAKIHVFPYSKREGTKASTMENQIDEKIKKERCKKVINLSRELELNYFNSFINSEVVFIKEVYKDNYLIGHTSNYLSIKAYSEFDIENEVKVIIKEIDYPYCIGEIVK
ncbi:MAG: tRNA (N(6)-L-threonylcarbamoyladenosine(37)-C(2))-methylthiotransferase MtaB [Bacilli bacterium]|nr:tRNA (N(6)-L-threonylcarbamoyladenosine(37)-C(2))-methylthiotransferase MtaB [Bacilli bacterium]